MWMWSDMESSVYGTRERGVKRNPYWEPRAVQFNRNMEQTWFEMADIRRRRFDNAVWIPLRASQTTRSGKYGYVGFNEEFFGAGSIAIPLRKRSVGEQLTWHDLGLMHDHCGYAHRAHYVPAEEFEDNRLKGAVPLVLSQ